MRVWSGVMAQVFPKEFEDQNAPYNYVRWYLGIPEFRHQIVVPKS